MIDAFSISRLPRIEFGRGCIDKLAPLGVTVTVRARGGPAGGQLEHAAQSTLAGAIAGRRPVSAK